jgi:hypothetical protein
MDKQSIVQKIADALNVFEKSETSIKFESDDVVRIDMVLNAVLDISMTDLKENNISIIALTENEANIGLNETGNLRILVSKEDFEQMEAEIANPSEPNEYLKASAKRFKEKN